MRFILLFFFFSSLVSIPAKAQFTKIESIPQIPDVISVKMPDGFYYAHGRGMFDKSLYEYIPKGETIENWSSMLSISGMGKAVPEAGFQLFIDLYFKGFKNHCSKVDIEPSGSERTPSAFNLFYQVHCETTSEAREKLNFLKPVELGLYKFTLTKSVFYEQHYTWHGSQSESQNILQNLGDFWIKAKAVLDDVVICDVSKSNECHFDLDNLKGDVQKVSSSGVRCQSSEEIPCNPAAILTLKAPNGESVEGVKKGLIFLAMDKTDISKPAVAANVIQLMQQQFQKGAPELTIVLKPTNNPNHIVTRDERTTVAAFSTFVGEIVTTKKLAESYHIMFMNFQ